MGFIDPATAYIRWGTATIPAGQTSVTVTHGASFTPNKITPNRTDLPITISNISDTTFDISIDVQGTDTTIEWMAGRNNNYVMSFDGVNDYISFSDAFGDITLNGYYTIAGTILLKTVTTDQIIFANTIGLSNRMAIRVVNNNIRAGHWDGGAYQGLKSGQLFYNTKYIFVYIYSNTTGILYLNNVIQTGAATNTVSAVVGARIGETPAGLLPLSGIVDRVFIWNRALSSTEADAVYHGNAPRVGLILEYLFEEGSGTTAIDTSSSGNHGTISGATYVEQEL